MQTKRMRKTLTVLAAMLGFGLCAVAQAEAPRSLSQSEIQAAVETEFLFDPMVLANDIDLTLDDGVVTLSGTVDHLAAKERAADLASTIRGVKAVVNRLRVVPPTAKTDAEIRTDIVGALIADPATDSYDVSVKVEDGKAILDGETQSYEERELCLSVAKSVSGVKSIDNRIQVDYEPNRPDAEIKAEVEEALKWNVFVDHAGIDVAVNDGVVKLTGVIGSAHEKREALADSWVAGVDDVNASGLSVEAWATDQNKRKSQAREVTASQIRGALRRAMELDPRIDDELITIDVSDANIVTLRGTADNLQSKRQAEMVALRTLGVAAVTNRIKVRLDRTPKDRDIESALEQAFLRNPIVESFEIDPRVVSGVVYLRGTVDSFFEKSEADDVAARTKGVKEVRNRLNVDNSAGPPIYDGYVYGWYPHTTWWYDYTPAVTTKSDAEIKREIEDELWWSPFVDSDAITVTVENGVATLEGEVNSWSDQRIAIKNAFEGGATQVTDELEIAAAMK